MLNGVSRAIDPNVIINRANQRFNQIDNNQDGTLTKAEVSEVFQNRSAESIEHFYSKFDGDGDGNITRGEFDTALKASVQRVLDNQSGDQGSGGRAAPSLKQVRAQFQIQQVVADDVAALKGESVKHSKMLAAVKAYEGARGK